MKIDKLTGTNAFLALDLDDAPCSAGVVRAAPKVLQGGAKAMARTSTYMFASRELKIGGASAGISAEPDEHDDAIAAFVEAVLPRAQAGELVIDPGKGVPPEALADLEPHDPRPAVHRQSVGGRPLDDHLLGVGAVAAATAALGSLDGRTAAVEPGPAAESITAALAEQGVTDVASTIDADVDVLFCGSRQGMIDGSTAESIAASVVVPSGAHALSAKGLAVLRRRDIVALPDFVTLSGPTFAGWPTGDAEIDAVVTSARSSISALVAEVLGHEEGPVLGACYRAESFLASWQPELPFGRPLA